MAEKIALLAPIPNAMVKTIARKKTGRLTRLR
jgi:hypothetical protein